MPDEPVPELFVDISYTLSCHWTLSTSQVPTDHLEGFGWGEVVADGFGVAYIVQEDQLHFNITGLAYEDAPDRVGRFKESLEESLDDLRHVMSIAPPPVIVSQKPPVDARRMVEVAPATFQEPAPIQNQPSDLRTPQISGSALPYSSDLHLGHISPLTSVLQFNPLSLSPTLSSDSLGFSLAYPQREPLQYFDTAGVVGDELGLCDL